MAKKKNNNISITSSQMQEFLERGIYVVVTIACMYLFGFWLGLIVGLVVAWAIEIRLKWFTRKQKPHKITLYKGKK